MTKATRRLARAAVLGPVTGAMGQARADLAIQFSSAQQTHGGGPASAGFSFTTTQAVSVASLDYISPGLGAGGAVRLYDPSGTTLASATVLGTDPTESTGGFTHEVHALATPLALAASTTYFILTRH